MTEYKNAIDAWVESESFKRSSEPGTLRAPATYRIYLENRLRDAFAAGWNARIDAEGKPEALSNNKGESK